MQKSMSKTVIVFKTEPNSRFEQVHLILKDRFEGKDPDNAMVEEANRIILQAEQEYSAGPKPTRRPTERSAVGWFVLGMLASLGIYSLASILLSLLI